MARPSQVNERHENSATEVSDDAATPNPDASAQETASLPSITDASRSDSPAIARKAAHVPAPAPAVSPRDFNQTNAGNTADTPTVSLSESAPSPSETKFTIASATENVDPPRTVSMGSANERSPANKPAEHPAIQSHESSRSNFEPIAPRAAAGDTQSEISITTRMDSSVEGDTQNSAAIIDPTKMTGQTNAIHHETHTSADSPSPAAQNKRIAPSQSATTDSVTDEIESRTIERRETIVSSSNAHEALDETRAADISRDTTGRPSVTTNSRSDSKFSDSTYKSSATRDTAPRTRIEGEEESTGETSRRIAPSVDVRNVEKHVDKIVTKQQASLNEPAATSARRGDLEKSDARFSSSSRKTSSKAPGNHDKLIETDADDFSTGEQQARSRVTNTKQRNQARNQQTIVNRETRTLVERTQSTGEQQPRRIAPTASSSSWKDTASRLEKFAHPESRLQSKIEVNIGRVEINAGDSTPQSLPDITPPPARKPTLSLEEYIQRRNGAVS